MKISDIQNEYKGKIDFLDLEVLIASAISKSREFVLAHPEYVLSKNQVKRLSSNVERRMNNEPVAYIVGHKEFYGLDFAVNKHTLNPRPETEQIVDLAIDKSNVKRQTSNVIFVDVGTGSGNIIISIAKNIQCHPELISGSRKVNTIPTEIPKQVRNDNILYFATDISEEALRVANKNAKLHGVNKKIKFLEGNLIEPFFGFIQNTKYDIRNTNLIIMANLPYLSKEIYSSTPIDVKKYEPRSALYSPQAGLGHYQKLLRQLKQSNVARQTSHVILFLEISPEQKIPITKLIKNIFPKAKIFFKKDLAGKWRICELEIK